MPGFFAQFTLSEMTKILRPDQIGTQDDSEWAQNDSRKAFFLSV
jgi:hypothetical protein